MTRKPVSGEPGRRAELQEAIDAANVRWGQTPEPVTGPELILVSPDIPVWRRWRAKWAKNRMLSLTAVIAAGTVVLVAGTVVLVVLAFVR